MRQYLDIVNHILDNGQWKENRTGTRALTCPNLFFSHDMSDGFPLSTTRKIPWKSLRVELEGFIRGITSKQWYKDRSCHYWDYWANPKVVDETLKGYSAFYEKGDAIYDLSKQQIQEVTDDLGPLGYSWQWRRFGEVYDEDDDGVLSGTDQLKNIVDMLRQNPDDRRMVCSGWNPNQMHMMALPPCPTMWNLVHINGTLNLFWHQRSIDTMLGLPNDIASYALLLELLCEEANLTPGNLSAALCDCHIYENHIEGAKKQLKRRPKKLPWIRPTYTPSQKRFNIFDWQYSDVELMGYNPYDKIDFGEIAI
jgi:thymidylate synthase